MKHLLNDMSESEKKSIREQHYGGMIINTSKFKKLLESKLGNSKPLISELTDPITTTETTQSQNVEGGGGSKDPKVGGYGVTLSTAKDAPTWQAKYKTSAPTKVDEENISFTKKLYKAGTYQGIGNYKYNCAKQDGTVFPWGINGKAIDAGNNTWNEIGKISRGGDNYDQGKMLTSFCALALPDGPYYMDNKLYYTCKDGSGGISTAPC